MNTLDDLCKLIESSKMYNIGTYRYFVFPFKGIFPIDLKLLRETVNLMKSNISSKSNKILTFMVDGVVIALPISLQTNKPLVIARDCNYNLPTICSFVQKTKYYERKMYFSGLKKFDKIEIIDAVISSGSTFLSVIKELEKMNIEVIGIHTVVNKVDYGGVDALRNKGYKVFSLVDLFMENNNMECKPSKKL